MPAPNITKTANHNFNVALPNGETIPIGQSTTSFTPKMVFPRWQGYSWNTSIGLSMAVTGNALAMAGMTSSNTATSVTASNSYFGITYSGVDVNPPYNESGGIDMSITIKKNIGNTLAFAYNNTNVNAYLQPSLTKEWTVGQSLPNGNTVASVTDTDVTDNQGNNVAHRPDYVVNSIAFMNATQGGMVSDVQAATGLTTGQIGMLYRMKMTGANGVAAWADWSIPNGTNLWLNLNTAGMTYPIVISPAGDTFGYTSAGGSWALYSTNTLGSLFTCPASGTATSVSVYTYYTGWYTGGAIFTGTAGSIGTLVVGSSVNIASASAAFKSCSLSGSLTNTTYYLLGYASSSTQYTTYTSGSANQGITATYSFGWSLSSKSYNAYQYSIYCTYTAGGGGVAVTPGCLALTTTDYAPTVALSNNQSVTPGVLAMAITGYAPSKAIDYKVTPSNASLTITGYAPTVAISNNQSVTPPCLAQTITGYAPTLAITANVTCVPPTLAQTITTYAPTVTAYQNVAVVPGVLSQTITCYAPTVAVSNNQNIVPSTLPVTVTSYAPTVTAHQNVAVVPGVVALSITGYAPTIAISNNIAIVPGTLAQTITTYVPTVSANQNVSLVPSTLALSITGYAPSVAASNNQSVVPGTLALSLAGYAPSVATPVLVTPNTLSMAITGYAPSVALSNNQAVVPGTVALAITTYAPTVTAPQSVSLTPGVLALTLTTYVPSVSITANQAVSPSTLALAIITYAPIITLTSSIVITPATLALILTSYPLSFTIIAYVIGSSINVTGNSITGNIQGNPSDFSITGNNQSQTASGNQDNLSVSGNDSNILVRRP